MALLHLLPSNKDAVTDFGPRMIVQADSAALSKYIAGKGRMPATTRATVPEQIDQALQRLHAAMAACEGLLTRLQAATASMEEVSYSSIAYGPWCNRYPPCSYRHCESMQYRC